MKNFLAALCISLVSLLSAQDSIQTPVLMSRDGLPVLPQARDWGIGIDVMGLLKNLRLNFITNTQGLTFRYFKDPKTAYRIGVRAGFNNYTARERVIDRVAATGSVAAYPAPVAMRENVWRRSSVAGGISFGIEKRRGASRLQGLYGAEFGVFFNSVTDKFSYGNSLDASSQQQIGVSADDAMSSSVLGNANNIDTVPLIQGVVGSARVLSRKNGLGFSFGARAFIGAEYFFLPKMSLGAEFGWGLGFSPTGRSETTVESIGVSTVTGSTGASVKRTTLDGGAESHLRLDADNSNFLLGGLSGTLRLNLYF